MVFRVLVTGFGPYGTTTINPSLAVVKALQSNLTSQGIDIVACEVTCEFNKCIRETSALIDEHQPDAVIMLGEYSGRAMVTVERVAINYNDATRYGLSDEAGYAPQGTKIVEGGPAAYFSTLPLRRIVRDLRAAGIPADISGDAGTLMCNHLMYGILHAVNGRDITAGWVHLPALPEEAAKDVNLGMPSMTAELSTRAVLSVVASLVENARQGGDISDAVRSRLLV